MRIDEIPISIEEESELKYLIRIAPAAIWLMSGHIQHPNHEEWIRTLGLEEDLKKNNIRAGFLGKYGQTIKNDRAVSLPNLQATDDEVIAAFKGAIHKV